MPDTIHVADADALIAMINTKDASHENAKEIVKKVTKRKEKILFPSTTIVEAITTFQVRLKDPTHAKAIAEKVAQNVLRIIPIDDEILKIAVGIYDPRGSKKNTMFDATVAATAKKYKTNTIFSFDKWYKSLGFNLLVETL